MKNTAGHDVLNDVAEAPERGPSFHSAAQLFAMMGRERGAVMALFNAFLTRVAARLLRQ